MPRLDIEVRSRLYPGAPLDALVRYAAQGVVAVFGDPGHVAVNVCDARCCFAGRAWPQVPRPRSNRFGLRARAASGRRDRRMVLVRIGPPSAFPRDTRYPGLKTAPRLHTASWREGVVLVAAHEFAHCVQFAERLRRSEVQADRIAGCVLDRFRADCAAGRYVEPTPPFASVDDPVTGSWGVVGEPGRVGLCRFVDGAWALLDAVAVPELRAALARHGAPPALATALPPPFRAPRPRAAPPSPRQPWWRALAEEFAASVASVESPDGDGAAWFHLREGFASGDLHSVHEGRATARAALRDVTVCTCEGCLDLGETDERTP